MAVYQVTHLGLQIIKIFIESPRERRHGYGLKKLIDAPENNVYYTLESLERCGWITSKWEAQESVDMRPARKLYEVTPAGIAEGKSALALLQLRHVAV